MNELQVSGPAAVRGHLSTAVMLLKQSLARPLAGAGPFTLFVMVDAAFSVFTPGQVSAPPPPSPPLPPTPKNK